MPEIVLNTIALEPNRWTADKVAHFRLLDLLEPIVAAGFQGLEVWQYHLARTSEAEVARVRDRADSLGLRFPVVGIYPEIHHSGAARGMQWRAFEDMIARVKLIGADTVKIWLGNQASSSLDAEARKRSLAFAAAMLEKAATHGLIITGENHANTLLDSLPMCRQVLQELRAPNLKICFQPYDFHSTARALSDYRALQSHVIHVHFQGQRAGEFVLLREAEIDYRALTGAFAPAARDGYWSIEFVRDCVAASPQEFDVQRVLDNASEDHRFLQELAAPFH